MMENLIKFLESNLVFLLFLVIAFGYLVAKIKLRSFSLGIASVLFVGLALGSLSETLILPDIIYTLGLIFFIYTTGLQSGPGFFASFNRVGLSFNLLTVLSLVLTACLVFPIKYIFNLKTTIVSGLYAGALTNTPALASVVENLKNQNSGVTSHEMNQLLGEPVAGFSIAYPFGVIGVILCFQLFKIIFRVNVEKESRKIANELGLGGEDLETRDVQITNPQAFEKKVSEIFTANDIRGVIISRIKKDKEPLIVKGETILEKDNIITLVGSYDAIEKYYPLFGQITSTTISNERGVLDYRRIFVSNKEVVGFSIRELDVRGKFGATITRLKRGDSEIVPTQETVLLAGDRIRVVAPKKDIDKITKFFGDSYQSISEVDYISISLGIAIGLLLGEIPIPLPGGSSFHLGFAGGPLIVSLILGKLGRTGKIVWVMSYNSNLTVRQLGVVLFLAGIGLKAGYSFSMNMQKYGLILLLAGFILTLFNSLVFMVLARIFLKTPYPLLIGLVSGMQTQPACIAYANSEIKNSVPGYGYSLVFPVAMISKIILAGFILNLLQ